MQNRAARTKARGNSNSIDGRKFKGGGGGLGGIVNC